MNPARSFWEAVFNTAWRVTRDTSVAADTADEALVLWGQRYDRDGNKIQRTRPPAPVQNLPAWQPPTKKDR